MNAIEALHPVNAVVMFVVSLVYARAVWRERAAPAGGVSPTKTGGTRMDLTPYIRWIVFLHVLGGFVFAAGHGVSMLVAFRVRRETDRARMAALLDLSAISVAVATIALIVLLIAGILAGVVLNSWSKTWIWVSLVLLVAIGFRDDAAGDRSLQPDPRRSRPADARLQGGSARPGPGFGR